VNIVNIVYAGPVGCHLRYF